MEVKNIKLNPDVIIQMNNDEMLSVWQQLEQLTDKEIVLNDSALFKLKLALKNNVFKLDKLII